MEYPIIICDDDQVVANKMAEEVKIAIQNLQDDNNNYADVATKIILVANTFKDVLGYVTEKNIINGIYFLDIELSDKAEAKNGVDLAADIKKFDKNAQIIFVTAYNKYAPLTYRRRIGAIDYVNKSQSDAKKMQRIEETLRRAVNQLDLDTDENIQEFTYKVGRQYYKLPQKNVYYIENSPRQHKVVLVSKNGQAEFPGNISQLEKDNPWLKKISQSCLVNTDNIFSIDKIKRKIVFPEENIVYYSKSYKDMLAKILKADH